MPPALPLKSPNSRRPPQSNCPPGNVPLPDYGQRLEPKSRKGGISLVTRPRLAPRLQSLPPMLHMRNPSPMPRCSKAPRGLFVQVCVTRVFTGISVSPGPSLRQRLSRYTFRAGRNFDVVRSLSSRSDYAFICGSLRRVRRVVALIDWPAQDRARQESLPLSRESSRYGVTKTSLGVTRALPQAPVGSTDMSRLS